MRTSAVLRYLPEPWRVLGGMKWLSVSSVFQLSKKPVDVHTTEGRVQEVKPSPGVAVSQAVLLQVI